MPLSPTPPSPQLKVVSSRSTKDPLILLILSVFSRPYESAASLTIRVPALWSGEWPQFPTVVVLLQDGSWSGRGFILKFSLESGGHNLAQKLWSFKKKKDTKRLYSLSDCIQEVWEGECLFSTALSRFSSICYIHCLCVLMFMCTDIHNEWVWRLSHYCLWK